MARASLSRTSSLRGWRGWTAPATLLLCARVLVTFEIEKQPASVAVGQVHRARSACENHRPRRLRTNPCQHLVGLTRGTDYDWGACEAKLNALPQFITEIDGLDIHFIHVRSRNEDALPLIVTHGWPGSIIEQLKIIEPLTNPTAHGASASDAFRCGDSLAARPRVLRQADEHRMGSRPDRACLGRADEAPRDTPGLWPKAAIGVRRSRRRWAHRPPRSYSAFIRTCLALLRPTSYRGSSAATRRHPISRMMRGARISS